MPEHLTHDVPREPSRWRISLRGILIVVLICSLPLAWIARGAYRSRWESWFARNVARYGGSVTHESESDWLTRQFGESLPGEAWIRETFEIENKPRLTTICLVSDQSNYLLSYLPSVVELDGVVLCEMTLTDREVDTLVSLPNLRRLILHDVAITPEQLARFQSVPALEKLQLDGISGTDAHLKVAGQITQLQEVIVRDSCATNQGAAALKPLVNLRSFSALRTQITRYSQPEFAQMKNLRHLQFDPNQPADRWNPLRNQNPAGLPILQPPNPTQRDDVYLYAP